MIAVDTNVLVRYVTNDDPDQAQRAVNMLAGSQTVFIPHSVLLEMEWVLRAVYDLDRAAILTAFRQVLGLPNTQVDAPGLVALTLERYEQGFDFADALHVALAGSASPLFTFDSRFARLADAAGLAVEIL
ncbi:type II toxin-antitoxin system VapC family toxin [Thiorhodovibrio frisius]|uniref:Ribonuclease VapC n=1 Tax=Thiorhodovibrio frisius TaxID=631362 RepID=H8Z4U4_9GAMM|nr:type II toxin-antitoxin system VapC family toxin [Thiorhodovibrio frisius]EIC20351.1 putative nucleic-acid-binding protein [Thiorhodovibrio frisius]WPL21090.1 putative nucleic acid-binding protein, contains PIN domain [Thiorhodovibrio frisius]